MNYRHLYHAGNFADVVKHAVLALLVEHLRQKDKPFFVLDSHAGLGRYDLASPEALKTKEAEGGVRKLWAAGNWPPELERYREAIAALNNRVPNNRDGGEPRWYPGSPALIAHGLRPRDRLVAVELHPADAAKLAAEFRRDPRVTVSQMDGYTALKSWLPPDERRGLVLIDPPFEAADEFDRLAKGLREAHRRWATGIYAVWYPIKELRAVRTFHQSILKSGIGRVLLAELWVENPGDPDKLTGCGLVLVNPPWTLAKALKSLLPFLAKVLARATGAGWRVEWLVPE
jgi:23S rRNA (adenine2030-N6)-methyltransferase